MNDLQEKEVDIPTQYRKSTEAQEEKALHPRAALSKNHSRYAQIQEDYRLPYKRDVDRIIHSKAYARYADKTQVVYLVANDHVTHRALHVQLVNNFAKGIAEILRLNVDLVEAIAFGHDTGHPPFGHEGEGYLSELSEEFGEGVFAHPWQSCRLLSEIEPLNLGLEVYDGFLCHDGGLSTPQLTPSYGKTWDSHFADKKAKLTHPERTIMPGTLEGCLVKICDTISYLGRDIEDAITVGILEREQVPETLLGTANKEILTAAASDIIINSYGKEHIALSEEVFAAIKTLRAFNFAHIYSHPRLKIESKKIQRSYRILFEMLLKDLSADKEKSYVWLHFACNKGSLYLENTSHVRMVIDYLSGMTDSYFVRTLENIIVPRQIDL